MRTVAIATLTLVAATAAAAPVTVEGTVVSASSRWVGDQDRIVTDAVVRTPSGDIVVRQLGGHVGGLTMRQFPGPELLRPGMQVALAAHHADDLSARTHIVVDKVKLLAAPPDFVRSGTTMAGNYLYWESGCVYVTIDNAGTKEIAGETEFSLVDQALRAWNDGIAACSYMKIISDGRADIEVGNDKVNVIKFRDSSWCRPATKDDAAYCYMDVAAGVTTSLYVDDASSDRDGAIVDSDIDLNGKTFAISNNGETLGTAECQADLLNTLTHELGHLLGLEHPCLADGDPDRLDGNGDPVPACNATNATEIVEATMYNFQDCGETKKASLEADDIAGVCAAYPKASDPGTCEHVDEGGGCCSAGRPDPVSVLVVCLGGLVVLGPRRRRRRS